ncbi:hypothetical protein BVH03_02175 [Pseudomonas sp. PA15(2017)]|uniref:hypothetical protein n=1 Tax=Pseudomonas sp. PA15(2017) TaxID=1932111 RepID=UPI00095AC52E|nr:hypothetical protein [Pseudomonas sp. PA15(2017)]OLU34242.1 hypothetical protein BVH03_02175 [Pseudomonas sp. PA15(2017)]
MRTPSLLLISLLSLAGIAQAQQQQLASSEPAGAVQTPQVPDPSKVDPETPPVIRDGRDNDESTKEADDAAEHQQELTPEQPGEQIPD